MKPLASIGTALICAAFTLLIGAAWLGAPRASAGEYTVHTCRTAANGWASTGGWSITKGRFRSIDRVTDTCPNGTFHLNMVDSRAHPADDRLYASLAAPQDTQIASFSIWRSLQLANSYSYRIWEIDNGAMTTVDSCFSDQGCHSRGRWSWHVNPINLFQDAHAGLDQLVISLTCGETSASSPCPAKRPGAQVEIHRADVTLEDNLDPTIRSVSGPVVDPAKPLLSGLQPVSIHADDRGGGVYQALFEVDGKVVDHHVIDDFDGNCQTPFESTSPCKLSVGSTVPFNTATVPDGTHRLRILVTDATGTNDDVYGPLTIRTANASCNPFPAASGERMKARFARHRRKARRTITVPYGHGARVRGRLLSEGHAPLAHTGLCVSEQPKVADGQITPASNLTTDQQGRFTYRVSRGPSRTLYFVHRVAGGAVASALNLNVRAPVRLARHRRTLHNGQTLTFRGHLGNTPFTSSGLLVELQAQRGRRHFQTFGVTHTNNRGQFRFPYTFTRTAGVQHYHIRAQLPAQRTYPFATGWSHPITVRVTGGGA